MLFPNKPDAADSSSPVPRSLGLAHRAAQEVLQKPLSESLEKLRHAQRALIRRKRRSNVRVSFRHSTSSRNSGAAKRTSKQLKSDKDHTETVKQQPNGSREPKSSYEGGHGCLGSPSKPPPPPPKDNIRNDAKNGVKKVTSSEHQLPAEPKSPIEPPPRSKTRGTKQQAEPEHQPGEVKKTLLPVGDTKPKEEFAAKRRPLQPLQPTSTNPRYSVFPKATLRRKPTKAKQKPDAPDLEYSESVRRSLIQQHHLSALVPADKQPGSIEKNTAQLPLPDIFSVPASGVNANNVKKDPKSQPRSSERTLDKFARELEEFARSTEAYGKISVSTPTTVQTHTSVRTLQEFLPYRQQFREAGLAVTSSEQRVLKKDKPGNSVDKEQKNAREERRAVVSPTVSLGSKESSITTVIHNTSRDPLVLSTANESENQNKRVEGTTTETTFSNTLEKSSEFSAASTPLVKLEAVQRKVIRLRPSTIFLVNKPLPTTPQSPQPSSSKVPVANTQESQAPVTSARLPSSAGTDGKRVLSSSEQDKKSAEWNAPASASRPSKGKEAVLVTDKAEESLPALRDSGVPSHLRHGIALLSKSSWVPIASRQLPTAIVEEKEPLPEKTDTTNFSPSFNQLSNNQTSEKDTKPVGTKKTTVRVKQSITNDTEILLPETWKHAVSTPSSFEKALDDVVRKLDAMEEKHQPSTGATDQSEKRNSKGRRCSLTKAPSPSQKLQKAAAIRQQRITEARDRQRIASSASQAPAPAPFGKLTDPASSPSLQQHPPPLPVPPRLRRPPSNGDLNDPGGRMPSFLPPHLRGRSQLRPSEDDRDISDRDVLKGLKIICAASADVDFDKMIQRQTGLRLRRFLADLRTFEHLSEGWALGGRASGVRGSGVAGLRASQGRRRRLGVGAGVAGVMMGEAGRRRMHLQAERESRGRSLRMGSGMGAGMGIGGASATANGNGIVTGGQKMAGRA